MLRRFDELCVAEDWWQTKTDHPHVLVSLVAPWKFFS